MNQHAVAPMSTGGVSMSIDIGRSGSIERGAMDVNGRC